MIQDPPRTPVPVDIKSGAVAVRTSAPFAAAWILAKAAACSKGDGRRRRTPCRVFCPSYAACSSSLASLG